MAGRVVTWETLEDPREIIPMESLQGRESQSIRYLDFR
jgi:hypothetical protein